MTSLSAVGSKEHRDITQTAERIRRARWLVLVVGLAVAAIAQITLFFYIALVVLGMVAVGRLFAQANATGLTTKREISASEVETFSIVDVTLTTHNEGRHAVPWLQIEENLDPRLTYRGPIGAFVPIKARKNRQLHYQLAARERGFFRIGPVVLQTSGPFGLAHQTISGDTHFLTVLPPTVDLLALPIATNKPVHEVPRRRSLFEDPTRQHGVRQYQVGDPLKRIHWRATARTRTLQTKIYEPAVLSGLLLALEMNVGAYGTPQKDNADSDVLLSHPQVELAVSTAASLACHIAQAGQAVGLFSNGGDAAERLGDFRGGTAAKELVFGPAVSPQTRGRFAFGVEAGRGRQHGQLIRLALARLETTSTKPLGSWLVEQVGRIPRELAIVVITPKIDAELDAALGVLSRAGIDAAVILIGDPRTRHRGPTELGLGIPVYRVGRIDDVRQLGAVRL